MARFRKKPVEVEAEQVRLNMLGIIPGYGWMANNPFGAVTMRKRRWFLAPEPMIRTLEGWLSVSPGDWIIKGIKGEFYPVRADIFEATYEAVSEQKG